MAFISKGTFQYGYTFLHWDCVVSGGGLGLVLLRS